MRKTTLMGGLLAAAVVGCGGGGSSDDDRRADGRGGSGPVRTDTGERTVEYAAGGDGRFRVRVDTVRREGAFLTVNATVACVRPAAAASACDTAAFGARPADAGRFAGVVAVDPAGQRAYDVVRTRGRRGVAYAAALDDGLAPGSAVRVWSRHAAPPAEVTTVDLLLPGGGPRLADVRVVDGGGVDDAQPAGDVAAAEPAEFPLAPDADRARGVARGTFPVTAVTRSPRRTITNRGGRRQVLLAADFLFDLDSDGLGPDGEETLRQAAAQIVDDAGDGRVRIDAYTDDTGSEADNRRSSRRRAVTVRDVLASRVGERILRANGRGEADPAAPNTTRRGKANRAGQRKNRRVTIRYALRDQRPPVPGPDPDDAPQAQPWSAGGAELSVRARGVRRVGNLSVLELDVRCDTAGDDGCAGALPPTARGEDAILLLDPAQNATYPVALTGPRGRRPLGTTLDVAEGATQRLSLFYAAIPSSTRWVTVRLPDGGSDITYVPVG